MVKLSLGRKVLAMLILENIFKESLTITDQAYCVHVDKIEMEAWNFGVKLELEPMEAEKLLRYLHKLQPRLSLGYRTQISRKIQNIEEQLYEEDVA